MNARGSNLLVLQGGGPSPVVNATLYGVIDEARRQGAFAKTLGARHGVAGLIQSDLVDLSDVPDSQIEQLKWMPGASLGTTRHRPSDLDLERIVQNLRGHDIHHLLLIGGNGSLRGGEAIGVAAEQLRYDLVVIGIPKTIDNDIFGTDRCPGFGTAARYVAQSVRDLGTDVRALPQPVSIYETMGRSGGWLAGASILARQGDDTAPHLIYLPEKPFEVSLFLDALDRVVRRLGYAIVVVSEGLRTAAGLPVFELAADSQRDAMNRALPGDVAAHLAGIVTRELNIRCRSEKPGICGRASMLHLSSQDQRDAELVGRAGVRAAIEGKNRHMVSLGPIGSQPTYTLVPLTAAAGGDRMIPAQWLADGPDAVGAGFIEYVRPIAGELLAYPPPLADTAPRFGEVR